MSSSSTIDISPAPVVSLKYRELEDSPLSSETALLSKPQVSPEEQRGPSPEEIAERIGKERDSAVRETEQRLGQDYENKLKAARSGIASSIEAFDSQRKNYFARAEAELVQFALAIAAKILHREAQIDPLLLTALVRVAIDKLKDGSSVTLRVNPRQAAKWKQAFSDPVATAHISIAEDASLSDLDCVLETELGSSHLGLDAQLKEIENGFCDLMALRPTN